MIFRLPLTDGPSGRGRREAPPTVDVIGGEGIPVLIGVDNTAVASQPHEVVAVDAHPPVFDPVPPRPGADMDGRVGEQGH